MNFEIKHKNFSLIKLKIVLDIFFKLKFLLWIGPFMITVHIEMKHNLCKFINILNEVEKLNDITNRNIIILLGIMLISIFDELFSLALPNITQNVSIRLISTSIHLSIHSFNIFRKGTAKGQKRPKSDRILVEQFTQKNFNKKNLCLFDHWPFVNNQLVIINFEYVKLAINLHIDFCMHYI